jgi:hypothetical protein
MTDSLADLEAHRATVQSQIAQLGDMRSGSITGTGGRCGNPNCHCHRDGDPGHGPYYRLTRKLNGKTVTETFSSPASLAKAQREVAECQRFRQLSEQLLEVNEGGLPVAAPGRTPAVRPGKKTAEAIQKEITREVDQLLRVIFAAHRKTKQFDLQAIEMAVRSAMHQAGAAAEPRAEKPCKCLRTFGKKAMYDKLSRAIA